MVYQKDLKINTGQHIRYRENRHLVGTVRYAYINAYLGINKVEEMILKVLFYVVTYFYLSLTW